MHKQYRGLFQNNHPTIVLGIMPGITPVLGIMPGITPGIVNPCLIAKVLFKRTKKIDLFLAFLAKLDSRLQTISAMRQGF